MHFQHSNSTIILIGKRKDELGGSVFYSLYNELGNNLPIPDLEEVKLEIFSLTDCIDQSLILSCHDIADGGVATALAEMTFKKNIGCTMNIDSDLTIDKILFSETGGFIIEVSTKNVELHKSDKEAQGGRGGSGGRGGRGERGGERINRREDR